MARPWRTKAKLSLKGALLWHVKGQGERVRGKGQGKGSGGKGWGIGLFIFVIFVGNRWAELTSRLEVWVDIMELNDMGEYYPVEMQGKQDVMTGGIFMIKQVCFIKG